MFKLFSMSINDFKQAYKSEKVTVSVKKLTNRFIISFVLGCMITGFVMGIIMNRPIVNQTVMEADQYDLYVQAKEEVIQLRYQIQATVNKAMMEVEAAKLQALNAEIDKVQYAVETDLVIPKYAYVIDYINRLGYENKMTLSDIKYLDKMCRKYDLDPHMMIGLIFVESTFNTEARSSVATGLTQFIPSTGKWIYSLIYGDDAAEFYDHEAMMTYAPMAIEMSCHYMKILMRENDFNPDKALMAYNGYEIGERYPEKVREFIFSQGGVEGLTNSYR